MTRKMKTLDQLPLWAVIIRAVHMRGPAQVEAIREIEAHRAWLSDDQIEQAGLTKAEYDAIRLGKVGEGEGTPSPVP